MKKIIMTVAVMAIIVGAIYAAHSWNTVVVNAKASANTAKFNEDVENLFSALQTYKDKMGVYPIGSNAEVVKAMQGHNPRNIIVVFKSKTPLNDKGEFIDPWGTPLRIYFSDNGVLIRSAGPNRRFDDSTVSDADDYYRSN